MIGEHSVNVYINSVFMMRAPLCTCIHPPVYKPIDNLVNFLAD